MRTIMSRSAQDESFSFSRRFLTWGKKHVDQIIKYEDDNDEVTLTFDEDSFSSSQSFSSLPPEEEPTQKPENVEFKSCVVVPKSKKLSIFKFKSIFTKGKSGNVHSTLGSKVVGTLFGHRRGHVHITFQANPTSAPAFLIELSTPTSVLVREMASGLVRVALECDKKLDKKGLKLLDEPLWRAYCNGKKCGYAMRRECGPEERRVLHSVGPITMGAGVLPHVGGGNDDDDGADVYDNVGPPRVKPAGELMYMRAKFERIVGSKDSEAFYMMNPDGNGGPELSVYLLRV